MDSGIVGGVMGGDENAITIYHQGGAEAFAQMSKTDTAAALADRIAAYFEADKNERAKSA